MSEPTVVHTGVDFGEGPRWHDGRLWFSDFFRQGVFSLGDDGERLEFATDGRPSGLGWMPDGTLLCVAMEAQHVIARTPDGDVRVHADLSAVATHFCNDLVVSSTGHAYVGNFGFDLDAGAAFEAAYLAHVTPDGEVRRVEHPLAFPNGSVITPDGSTLIVGETFAAQYTAFDLDESGHPVNPRVWARFEGSSPDGCCLDADGAIWMSDFIGKRFARVHADGTVSREISVDGNAVACMLGGADGRTLYGFVSPGSHPDEVAGKGLTRIIAVDVESPRAGLP
ncbi:MAG: SMP-30/gluconolactonase/LRE family protein [Actinomycetota bacterium]